MPCAIVHGLDWNDLRHFLAVARVGTLVRAARELGVEHTTVSRRLAALEAALGVRLFVRGPDGLALTPAGQDVLPAVEAIAEHIASIERRVSGSDGKVAGAVRLTIPESANEYFMSRFTELRARHPELVIEILSDNRALDLRRGEADLAVRFRDNEDPDLVLRKVGIAAGWALYASQSYLDRKGPLASIEDLAGHDVIGYDASLSETTGALWLRKHARDANFALRGNSITAVTSAAAAGIGIAALPCFAVHGSTTLLRLSNDVIGARDIVLAMHPDLAKTARVRATIDFLLELFARDAAVWKGC